jgi:hypothetical protein
MKTTLKKVLIAGLASLLCSLSLLSCGGVSLRPGAEGLYDKDHNVSYSHASPVYVSFCIVLLVFSRHKLLE